MINHKDHKAGMLYSLENDILDSPGENLRSNWVTPWADLMMTMFITFVILYIYFSHNKNLYEATRIKLNTSGKQIARILPDNDLKKNLEMNLENVFEKSKMVIFDNNLNDVSVSLEDKSIKISAEGDNYFDSGKADLKEDLKFFLDITARIIKKTRYKVNIIGHTDNVPIKTSEFPSNWELSTTRAINVLRYLVEQAGVEPERFTASGVSKYRPNGSFSLSKNQNRRVEIIITENYFTPF